MAQSGGVHARRFLLLALLRASAACEELVEVVPSEELQLPQRGVFTASGRYVVIAERSADRADAGSWMIEVTRTLDGGYRTTNLVAGALEGTLDGTLGGVPRGAPCAFTGLAAQGETLYGSCVGLDGGVVSLLRVDLDVRRVRAGRFTSCNMEPATAGCQHLDIYPNGMAVDALGRVYMTDSLAYTWELLGGAASRALLQVSVDLAASQGAELAFRHRAWFGTDIVSDGFLVNGVQIDGDVLYYAAGSNLNKVRIRDDGTAGEFRVHYRGPPDSYIDDFAIRAGEIALIQLLPPPATLVRISASSFAETAHALGSYETPLDKPPASIAFQPEAAPAGRVFPSGSMVLTCFWTGGLQIVPSSVLWR